jgi:glycosyltransferase involved in cell wall biosynthesis
LITVALDAEHTRQTAAGTARASRALTTALAARGDVKPITIGGGPLLERRTWKKRLTTLRQDLVWYPWLGRHRAREIGADVYHCPTPRAPLTRGNPPLVVTVHDLVPMLFPKTMTKWSRFYGRSTMKLVLDAADLVAASSSDTANDLETLLKVDGNRIRVVPLGVESIFFSTAVAPRLVDEPYVLFVGTAEPRKNIGRLLDAMQVLRDRGRQYRLVIAGGGGWGGIETTSPLVTNLGRVSDAQLMSLYQHAECLALPSLHEGFGFPALEAMAAGAPVVAGARGALPEIVGDAGVLVDPYDVTQIADGIDLAISARDKFIALGRANAARFTWERTADLMAEAYRELV